MTLRALLVLFFTLAGFGIGSFYFYRLYRYLRLGKDENRLDHLPTRIKIFLTGVIGQEKMFKDIIPGLSHAFVFWGFLVVTLGTLELILSGIIPAFSWSFLGVSLYSALLTLQDIFYILVLCAIVFFFYRRLVLKPDRLTPLSRHSAWDAYFILSLIAILMISSLTLTGSELIINKQPWDTLKPFATVTASLFQLLHLSPEGLKIISEISWWTHFLTVLLFFCYLPFSKHLHVVAAAPNVFFTSLKPRGRLNKLDLADESQTEFGVGKI